MEHTDMQGRAGRTASPARRMGVADVACGTLLYVLLVGIETILSHAGTGEIADAVPRRGPA